MTPLSIQLSPHKGICQTRHWSIFVSVRRSQHAHLPDAPRIRSRSITSGGTAQPVDGIASEVRQGDSVYVPKGHAVRLVNDSDGWLECLTLSAPDTRA